jgi:Na+/glutamate symporter
MSGGTKVMVKVILVFFLFPAIVEITNLALSWFLFLPLHLLPKAWQHALFLPVGWLVLAVSVVCGVLAVRRFWPKMIEVYDDEVASDPAQTPP